MYILYILIFSIVIYTLFNLLKIFVFSKLHINKWIVLAISFIIIIPSFFIPSRNIFILILQPSIAAIFLLWFYDLFMADAREKRKKKNEIKIKPKAKPNRIQNNTSNINNSKKNKKK